MNAQQKGSGVNGWRWMFNAKKIHFFNNGRALCGKWMILSSSDKEDLTVRNSPLPDECRECHKRAKKARGMGELGELLQKGEKS